MYINFTEIVERWGKPKGVVHIGAHLLEEREEYLKQNPHIQSIVTSASIVSGVAITGKVPDGFKEVLSKVAESHRSSSVADNHGKKSSKEIKTKQLVDKHIS